MQAEESLEYPDDDQEGLAADEMEEFQAQLQQLIAGLRIFLKELQIRGTQTDGQNQL